MQDYYAARAAEYDRVYAKPERQADLRQIEQWLPGVLAGRSVLEVACGTGYWTQFFAPRCTRIVAVDSAPETIQIAKSRVPPEKVEFVVGDAYSLPPQPAPLRAGFADSGGLTYLTQELESSYAVSMRRSNPAH